MLAEIVSMVQNGKPWCGLAVHLGLPSSIPQRYSPVMPCWIKKASRVSRFVNEAMQVGVDALDESFAAAVTAVAGDAQFKGRLGKGFVVVFAELAKGCGDVVQGAVEMLIS